MQYIKRDHKTHNYFDKDLIGKSIYLQRFSNGSASHHIFKLTDIVEPTYMTTKHYFFYIPIDKENRAFCYDGMGQIDIMNNDKIFILDNDEYLDTFRSFVKNDGCKVANLPDKIIQDKKES